MASLTTPKSSKLGSRIPKKDGVRSVLFFYSKLLDFHSGFEKTRTSTWSTIGSFDWCCYLCRFPFISKFTVSKPLDFTDCYGFLPLRYKVSFATLIFVLDAKRINRREADPEASLTTSKTSEARVMLPQREAFFPALSFQFGILRFNTVSIGLR